MPEKITIQDMADELGLSRNTVSKILNGKYTGPDETRERVIQKAIDLQYKGYGVYDKSSDFESDLSEVKNIMILSKGNFRDSIFFSNIIDGVQKVIRESTCNILVSIILEDDIKTLKIPPNINKNLVDGIICMEVFQKDYIEKLLSLGIPLVFVDFYNNPREIPGKYDVIMMDNEYNVYELTKRLIDRGLKRIGFVGDTEHCRGFYERYKASRDALRDHGNYNIDENSIIYPNGPDYFDVQWMSRMLLSKKELPEAFVCANDALAACVLRGLGAIGKTVPADVELISFDNTVESELVNPKLTTVGTFKYDIGISAAENLLLRIQEPDRKSQIIYIETEIIERYSTKI
ncbi:MAG: hypothetical protein K0R92_977 [Lachnospiraceae bacterium]|jgi:LacI family transcriptional regulator|nr:hypothetical protein [Lachnospiraceae bacterium]